MNQIYIGIFDENKEVDGVMGWHWITSDVGAWYGPAYDWMDSHKPNILKYCDLNGVAIQAGGNLGMYPKLLSKMFKSVYTFEPDRLNFYTLSLNCNEENIFPFNTALGQKNGFVKIVRNTMENVGMHTVDDSTSSESYIPMIRLDDIIPTHPHKVNLLMLDIEGYEINALKGASKLISHNKPVIFVEQPNKKIDEYLKEYGYKMVEKSKMDGIYVAN